MFNLGDKVILNPDFIKDLPEGYAEYFPGQCTVNVHDGRQYVRSITGASMYIPNEDWSKFWIKHDDFEYEDVEAQNV